MKTAYDDLTEEQKAVVESWRCPTCHQLRAREAYENYRQERLLDEAFNANMDGEREN